MTISPAYEEIIDFIASGTTSDSIVTFRPSEAVKERLAELIRREKLGQLSGEETDELNHYMQLEHLMRLAKVKARKHLDRE